jgi:prefoldin subunit 5
MSDFEYILRALNDQLHAQQSLIDYYREEYTKALATIEEMKKAKEAK